MKKLKDFVAMYVDYVFEYGFIPYIMTQHEASDPPAILNPCDAFTIALEKGRIDEPTYAEARESFGDMWDAPW